MGNKEINLAEPIKNKIFKNYENDKIRVGICLMQGWRKTMEDISLALPNFQGENSLFGIFDGHGGSIVSQFAACNIDNILKNSKSYKNLDYKQSLIDSFVTIDELLRNYKIDRYLQKILTRQKNLKSSQKLISSIISKELIKNNIKNDPNTDYLFFCYSDLDYDINLKYKFPDLQKFLENKNNIKDYNNGIYTINNINKKTVNYNSNSKSNVIKKRSQSTKKKILKNFKKDEKIKIILDSIKENPKSKNENILETENISNMDIKSMLETTTNYQKKSEKSIPPFISNDVGTTANVCLLTKNYIYIANVGDSLSVMYKNKKAIRMNKEHKTTSEKEYMRIIKKGGVINNFRINGKINITRALGDLSYKNKYNNFMYEQDIIAVPEVYKYPLEDIDFIVMGSDGFWDYGDDVQIICDNIYEEIKKNPKRDLCDLIGTIFDKALAKANNYTFL